MLRDAIMPPSWRVFVVCFLVIGGQIEPGGLAGGCFQGWLQDGYLLPSVLVCSVAAVQQRLLK
jgi:hypothetical protein